MIDLTDIIFVVLRDKWLSLKQGTGNRVMGTEVGTGMGMEVGMGTDAGTEIAIIRKTSF